MLLGWNPGTDQEIFTFDELVKQFKLEKVQKGGAIFNQEKLDWMNKQYINKMTMKEFIFSAGHFLKKDIPEKALPLIKEKINKFGEIKDLLENELSFINPLSEYPKESLKWKDEKEISDTRIHLTIIINLLSNISKKEFTKEYIKSIVWPYAEEKGRGNVLWPMRFALSGKERSPDPFTLAEILGKEETIKRLRFAHEYI